MKEIKANSAGLVVEFLVQQGEIIATHQDIVVLESMKMYISEQASSGGLVKQVRAQVGDMVRAGDVLLEVEELPLEQRPQVSH